MRVANLNMTDPSQNCPDGFNLVNRTTPPLRTCGRPGPSSCVSTVLSVHEPTYSHVCGRIIGYQYGGAKGFIYAHTILTFYLTGVSLTYNNLQHIWSFAAARDEETHDVNNICPCIQPKLTHTGTVQSFVGQDYFCDTGSATAVNPGSPQFYDMDPLWDGQGCGGNSTCCEFNNPPWFCKQLSQPITNDIDLRLCHTADIRYADINLELVEIYVR